MTGSDEAIVVRVLEPSDLEAVIEFDEQVFGGDAWPRDWFDEIVADPNVTMFVAELEQVTALQFAGYCALHVKGADGEVATIGVDEAFRRRGVGRKMMSVLVDRARTSGLSSMSLNLRTDNAGARKLYESFGFRTSGVEPRYYDSDGADAEIMTLEL
ncbi:ribosomal protein S18-alanine N-acetyltransferase [Promicromonospora sp. NPDC060204]|uniref:ribosomal protein S18-alanine N-acetyltransferase n=1 Tax=Promicromonospora sp. NPDC060204 TaxID=3347071 RepID=UPI0036675382